MFCWNHYRLALLHLVWAISICIPLTFYQQTLRSFDMPKALVLKVSATILIGLFLLGITLYKKWAILERAKYFILLVFLFIISSSLSTFFSTDSWVSLYGVYERQMGLQAIFAAMGLGLILCCLIEDKKELIKSFVAISIAAGLVGLQGTLSQLGLDPFNFPNTISGHLTGMLGHHNFLGNYLAVTSLVTLALIFHFKNKNYALILLSGSFLFQLISLYYTLTRGAYFAFLMGVFAVSFYFSIKKIQQGQKKYARLALIAFVAGVTFVAMGFVVVRFNAPLMAIMFALLIALFLYASYRYFMKRKLFTKKTSIISLTVFFVFFLGLNAFMHVVLPKHIEQSTVQKSLSRYYSIYTLSDRATPRFQLWRETLGFLPKSPMFGIGLETFRREFMAHKSAYLESLERHTNYDNPHNSYFYYLASLGIVGSLPYFLILLSVFSLLIYILLSHEFKVDVFGMAFFGYFFTYWVSSIPGFDVVVTLSIFWLMLALFNRYSYEILENQNLKSSFLSFFQKNFWQRGFALTSLVVLFTVLLFTVPNTIDYFVADKHMKATRYWLHKKNLPRALQHINKARELNPNEHYYIKTKGEILYQYARGQKDRRKVMQYVVRAEKVLNSGLEHSWAPENLYIAKINGRMMLKDYPGAIRACDYALKYSPHLKQIKDLRKKLKRVLSRTRNK